MQVHLGKNSKQGQHLVESCDTTVWPCKSLH